MNEEDLTRIKEYRQIRKEIRRSDKYLVVPLYSRVNHPGK